MSEDQARWCIVFFQNLPRGSETIDAAPDAAWQHQEEPPLLVSGGYDDGGEYDSEVTYG